MPFFISAYKNNQTIPIDNSTTTPPGTLTFPTGSTSTFNDTVVFWYRPHPKSTVPSADPLPAPTSYNFAEDLIECIAILATAGTIVIHTGENSQSFSGVSGFNQFSLPFSVGSQSVELVRNGVSVACGVGNVPISSAVTKYNFNAVVGKAVPGGGSAPA